MILLLLFNIAKLSENIIFTAQLYNSCALLCLLCSCCCCGWSGLVQVLVWIRVVCFSAQLLGHLWRWNKREERGRHNTKRDEEEDGEAQGCRDGEKKKLATKSLQLRSEGTFYLLIRTEQSRCSLGPEHSVFSGLNPLCFSSRRSRTSGCLWTENSIQQPCRDFCQKDILTKLYLIFYNVTSNSKCLDKKSQALEKWNHMWARKREKMCPKLNR